MFAVILFAKKSKPVHDAQGYAVQNPNCTEIKIHSNKNDMVECFLHFESDSEFPKLQGEDTLYINMARFIGERFPEEFPLRVRHVYSFPGKTSDSIRISGKSITIAKGKNSEWRDKKSGCKFPGPCPVMPLKGSAVPQKSTVEDNNTEQIHINKFSAKGKAPLNAILPGKILKIERDSLFSVTIYHGENIYSKTSGLDSLSEHAQIDSVVSTGITLGFLPPQDTAFIFVEITRNGKYKLWETFYSEVR